ncbi:acyl-ACP--UDP-N-acetylglucosamine O-acyltransferase [Amaricoccus solimangrovi]|uniref:Acyl-[acyl-carrier-protein]--UDP-N-acetylglucosamine O-acyltransferase n=1 Tax=Amaricoccus solimangrovi TaxID=2589815 RepID=A0A501WYZ7_9RHOB|nr:acyl-ACP--UDP-N-acetylglucosamine O-acyltransferase [Amaricoccus solimangrovi]TPE53564.1 acyl-ACP--UDP-N-acetylglucosamine O-acyltransferase [Amaricoccus solimangrovi]
MAIDPGASIHPTAIIEDGAEIGAGARIGPYCVVGPEVVLGEGVVLHSHVAVAGITRVGPGTQIFPFASIGHAPQDLKYAGERTELVIGANNRVREHVTMNPGTAGGGGVTRVGDGGLFMMSVHIGHDCQVGDGVILANNATLAGHVVLGDNVILGGLAAVHQFVRIGRGAMIGGLAGVVADVIPYGSVIGERAHLAGLNLVGLKRRGAERAQIHGLRAAFGEIFAEEGSLRERADAAAAKHAGNPLVEEVLRFITAESSRSFTVPA